jgi:site-specific DNA-methyltransferase (adenine-specific)
LIWLLPTPRSGSTVPVPTGYIEAPRDYYSFTLLWLAAVENMVRPGGAIVIFSGRTNLRHILNAAAECGLIEMNHLIWQYGFGVYNRTKFINSHYHILYYVKPDGQRTFNTYCRYDALSRDEVSGCRSNYLDREDVWEIPREYRSGERKTVNRLPTAVVLKVIEYLSNPGDCILDPFVGSGTVPRVAVGMKRRVWGCELSDCVFDFACSLLKTDEWGWLEQQVRSFRPKASGEPAAYGRRWQESECKEIVDNYLTFRASGMSKGEAVAALQQAFSRGEFSIQNKLKELGAW